MSIRFDNVTRGILQQFNATAPAGAWIGLIGNPDSGVADLVAFVEETGANARLCPNLSALSLAERLLWISTADHARRGGAVIFTASSDPELLRNLCDEIWWIDGGALRYKGDPDETIALFTADAIAVVRAKLMPSELHPSLRRGDGRAKILSVETLDAQLNPSPLLTSGEPAAIRVKVRYEATVEDPVVGIMIRTRIGFEVFGTNTELEQLKIGPVAAGEERTILFRFGCALCPQSYTVTAASHDPNGVWHEWLEDAIAFAVADTRYTAGVANLRARAELC